MSGSIRPAAGDPSNGYEAIAAEYLRRREEAGVGVEVVHDWARGLPPGGAVLDLGCGHGAPIASALIEEGFDVHGIDASPTLVAAFRARHPDAKVRCGAVEDADLPARSYDGVLAIGLLFLLDGATQRRLIRAVAQTLRPGGRFLFTAPREACEWTDVLTGRRSHSLGAELYAAVARDAGLALVAEHLDEGDNHYFDLRLHERAALPRGGELPFVDEHRQRCDAAAGAVWTATLAAVRRMAGGGRFARLLGCDPARATAGFAGRPGDAVPGFRVEAAEPPRTLVLRGRHRFADYRLTFLVEDGALRAVTHAAFPGLRGRLYRAAVIGSGAHRFVTRRLLRSIAHAAAAAAASSSAQPRESMASRADSRPGPRQE